MLENKPVFLITGLPGSGKTARGVEAIQKAALEGRPIFQTGIPELKVPHIAVPPITEWTELRPDPDNPDVLCPYFTFPERSLIYISEAQRWFRPRPNGSKVPDHVAAFETTRHTGVTFILDTQHPDFIDSHVRKLVGQHVHLLDHGLLGRWHYEWPYTGSVEQFKNAPIKKKYSLPKHVFDLYKSSSLHIKRSYTIPPRMVMLALLFVAISAVGFRFYTRFESIGTGGQTATANAGAVPSDRTQSQPIAKQQGPKTPEDYLTETIPVSHGRPETAPMYAALLQVRNVPHVVGCIDTGKRCKCINQQGTDAGLDNTQCRNWIKSPPFDPYTERKEPEIVAAVKPEPANPPAPAPEQPFIADPTKPQPAPTQTGAASREGAGFRPA